MIKTNKYDDFSVQKQTHLVEVLCFMNIVLFLFVADIFIIIAKQYLHCALCTLHCALITAR